MHILLKQDKLGQDVFLIGSPGPSRRLLAMQYLVNLMINNSFSQEIHALWLVRQI